MDIPVNKFIWESLPELDRQHITAHLLHFGVINPEQRIVPQVNVPVPEVKPHVGDINTADMEKIRACGVDWLCRAICDSTQAEKNCTLYGQPLLQCLKTIEMTRELFDEDAVGS